MNQFPLIIALSCALFLNTSLSAYLGIEKTITIAFIPMILYIASNKINWAAVKNKYAIIVLSISIVIIIGKYIMGQDYLKTILCFTIMPMIISISFENLHKRQLIIVRKVVLLFFIIECSMAIIERIYMMNILNVEAYTDLYSNVEAWEFRSTALLGHPLMNAMAVAVIMSFIITSNLSKSIKIGLLLMGYLSLFCFNARGAIVVTTLLYSIYLFKMIKNSPKKKRISIILIFILVSMGIGYIVINSSLGGRLLHDDKLFDGSAMTRIQVFNFYKFIGNTDLLIGNPDSYLYVTSKLRAGGVENGPIVLILDYGIIFTIPLLISLFIFQYTKLSSFPLWDKLLILSIFYLIGCMNPNLAYPLPWTLFIFCYYAFKPSRRENRIKLTNAFSRIPTSTIYTKKDGRIRIFKI